MMNNYVSCEDCLYKDMCHEFDAFFGCEQGQLDKNKEQQVLGAYVTDECVSVFITSKQDREE